MKTKFFPLLASLLALGLFSASAQPGPGGGMMGTPKGPNFGGSLSKLLGDVKAFSATIEVETKGPGGDNLTIPGKMSFSDGKSRMEMDMSKAMGASVPAEAAAQIKAMGMDVVIVITQPEKKASYTVFPGLKAYLESPLSDTESSVATANYKVESTELGKETINGEPCIKNKVVVTDDKGTKHESTVWNATNLKKFPLKIEAKEQGQPVTMLFKDVKLTKPEDSQFSPPADLKRYDSYMAMMQEEIMKRMGGAGGFGPPPR